MSALPTVGRYLYAIPMAIFGLFHFMNASSMAGMVPIPGGVFWIYLTGLALLAAAVSIGVGKHAVLATRLLGLMLLIFALTIHLVGVMNAQDPAAMQASMSSMLKDTALAGGALVLSGVFERAEGTDRAVQG
ncbi:MAG: DoxX family protein [Gemmatimonadota bacterium]|nr:DoxX family protein [Gemmatimonadota bacterium]